MYKFIEKNGKNVNILHKQSASKGFTEVFICTFLLGGVKMIEQIYIKNFKAFEKETIPIEKHNIIIGENDAGKSTILQALDIFFNQEKIDKVFVRDTSLPVEIGILFNNNFYKKIYSGASYKLSSQPENISNLDYFRYIYIPVSVYDPKNILNQLAISKALSTTPSELIDKLKEIVQKSVDDVIESIDSELLIINDEKTDIVGKEAFKYDAAIKYSITSDGIPVEARGSGFQKNLMYALLVGNSYDNVILGIDEIENSFSINNCNNMIKELQSKIGQTLISTHSVTVLEVSNDSNTIPLYTDKYDNISKLLDALDSTDSKIYLLVEGKFDLPWYKKSLSLLGVLSNYILLPAGGESNAESLKKALEAHGKKCIIIKDGDTNDECSIQKDCIELYVPLSDLNRILNVNLTKVPNNKKDFFDQTVIEEERNEDSVKRILASHVDEFLKQDNPLITEVAQFLNIDDKQ